MKGPVVPGRLKSRRSMHALEQRIVYDGAVAATVDHALPAATPPRDVVFVDTAVKDWQALAKAAKPGAQVVLLDPAKGNEMDQIAAALKGDTGLTSISILSHGNSGMLKLGNNIVDTAGFSLYGRDLQVIQSALGPNGDIMLYGCDVGAGTAGRTFIDTLAHDTGAVVAASTNLTGAGGDWNLEVSTGTVDAASALDASALANYHYDLATLTVTSGSDAAVTTGSSWTNVTHDLRNAIYYASNGDTIDFSGLASATVNGITAPTVTLSAGVLAFNKNLTIDGGTGVTINANNTSGVFDITGGNVTLENMTITGGLLSGAGGGYTTLNGYRSMNGGSALGAGIAVTGGTLTLTGDTITGNHAAGGGGGVYLNNGIVNEAYAGGGGAGWGTTGGGAGGNGGTYGTGQYYAGGTGGGGTGGEGSTAAHFTGNYGGYGGSNSVGTATPHGAGGGGGKSATGYYGGGGGGTAGKAATSLGYIGGGGGGTAAGPTYTVASYAGGSAAGAMYIGAGAKVFMASTTITDNLGAGGGGGGTSTTTIASGAGGAGIGGIYNKGAFYYQVSTVHHSANYGKGGSAGTTIAGASAGSAGSGSNAGTEWFVGNAAGSWTPPPSVASASYNASTHVLSVTAANMTAGDTIDSSKLTLTGDNGSTYTLTSGTTTATTSSSFSVTLDAADQLAVDGILDKTGTTALDGSTTYNLAAAASWDSTAAAPSDLTGNTITVSAVAAPTMTHVAYDATSGVLTVTGTEFVGTPGATNDITVSDLTLTGQGNKTYTLTTTSVEASSPTAFSVTLNAADKVAVNGLLDKVGTSAIDTTAFNLAATSGWDSALASASATNAITVSNVVAPSISTVAYSAAGGLLTVTGANFVGTPGATNDITVSDLTLTGQGGSYTLTSGNVEVTDASHFSVSLNAADQLAVDGMLNKLGTAAIDTTTYNLSASAGWDSALASASATNAISVASIANPSISSATYDASSGVLSVTGVSLVGTLGTNNDITVSDLTLTGQGGGTYTLTTTSVEATSTTAFSVTLNAADQAAVNVLLDKNGAASADATTYNLAAATGWDSVLASADLTGNGVTVSNSTPAVPGPPTMTAASDSGISSSDGITNVTQPTFTGTGVNGDRVYLLVNNGTTTTTTSTYATVSGGTWSLTLPTALSDGPYTISAEQSSDGGVTFSAASGSESITIDTTPPSTTVGSIGISADTGASSSDFITKTATQTITGTLSAVLGTDTLYGSTDGGTNWTDITSMVSGTTITWTGATLVSGSNNITFKVVDVAGNYTTPVATGQNYTLDQTAPTEAVATATLSHDTGVSSTDFITKTTSQTISGTLSANLQLGDTVNVSLDNGLTWSGATAATGTSTWSLGGQTLTGSGTLLVEVTDTAGNYSTPYSHAYTVDSTLPGVSSVAASNLTSPTASSFTFTVNYTDNGGGDSIDATSIAAGNVSVIGPGTVGTLTILGASYNAGTGTATYTVQAPNGGVWNSATDAGAYDIAINGSSVQDLAGNLVGGNPTAGSFNVTFVPTTTVVTAALSHDTGSSSSDWITNTASQTISGTLSANLATGESVQVSFDGGSTWSNATGYTVGSSSWSDTATLSGSGTFEARVTNADGSSSPYTQTYTLDTSAAAPTLALAADTGASATDNITSNGTVNVSGLETGATWQYSTDNGTNWTTGSGTSFTLTGDGAKSVLVQQTDLAGNTSANGSLAFTLDTTAAAPSLSLASDTGASATDHITSDGAVNVSGLETGATWQYSTNNGTSWTTGSGTSFTLTGDGAKSVLVQQTDLAGNTSANGSLAFTLDTTAPSTPTIALAADTGASSTDKITSDGTVNVSGLQSGTTWQYSTDGGTSWTAGSGTSFTLTGDGAKSVIVRQTDTAGNASPNSAALAFTLDQSAPTVAHNTGLSVSTTMPTAFTPSELQLADSTGDTVTFTLGTLPAKGTLSLNGTALTTGGTFTQADIDNGLLTFQPASGTSGTDSFTFTAADAAGNALAAQTVALDINAVPRPELTSVPPVDTATQPPEGKTPTEPPTPQPIHAVIHQHMPPPVVTTFEDAGVDLTGIDHTLDLGHQAPGHGIGDHTYGPGQAFNFSVPQDAFLTGSLNTNLNFSATLVGGAPLPDWMHFDSQTGVFSGTMPSGGSIDLHIRVKATDAQGHSATATFIIRSGTAAKGHAMAEPQGAHALLAALGVPASGLPAHAAIHHAAHAEASQRHAPHLTDQLQREARRFAHAGNNVLHHVGRVAEARRAV